MVPGTFPLQAETQIEHCIQNRIAGIYHARLDLLAGVA